MCEAAKWVIVSKNDVSRDDSKLVFQTTGIGLCDSSATSFFLDLSRQDWRGIHVSGQLEDYEGLGCFVFYKYHFHGVNVTMMFREGRRNRSG